MMGGNDLGLTVHVDADEWSYAQRRMTYLSAMMARILQDENELSEWFTAEQLVSLKLPGMPLTKSGIAQKAAKGKWVRMFSDQRTISYHVASLPARAFDALISRLLRMPEVEADALPMPDLRPGPEPIEEVRVDNTAPAWVLPLMRLIKGEAQGNLGLAWKRLPEMLPDGIECPSVETAAGVLITLGLHQKGVANF